MSLKEINLNPTFLRPSLCSKSLLIFLINSFLLKFSFESLILLQKVFHQVKADLHNLIKTTNASVECSELPQIIANETRINVLFQNLINNAIKFTEQGEIEVRYKEVLREGEQCVEIWVQDTGLGIPEHLRESIFERFTILPGFSRLRGSNICLISSNAFTLLSPYITS